MPELPDVENYARYLRRNALHQAVRRAEIGSTKIVSGISGRRLASRLKGRRIERARRHGKHLFAALDKEGWLAMHFGMTGRLKYFKDMKDDPEHDRLRLDFKNGNHLAFDNQRMFGRIRLIDDPDDFIEEKHLGPDALDPKLDRRSLAERIRHRDRSIKAALMDQKLLAGIGNIYSDEILFQARLHPNRRTHSLDEKEISCLHRMMRRVLRTAIRNGAGTADVARKLPDGYLLPHRKRGASCPRCGGKVRAIKAAGRTAYYCPRCQQKR